MVDPLPGKSHLSRPRGFALGPNRGRNYFRGALGRSRLSVPWLLSVICLCLVLLTTWQAVFEGSNIAKATSSGAKTEQANLEQASEIEATPLPPITLGLEAPIGTEALGNEFLRLGASDRLLDREVGERVRSFWPLRELLLAFNRDFRATETPLTLELSTCSDSDAALAPIPTQPSQSLHLCYDLLQRMDDYADDLSGSLTEQHLAVLDMLYFTVTRELSRLILAEAAIPSNGIAAQVKSHAATVTALAELYPEAALDQLTAQLPQLLKLQQQSIILSGTQWLFNQGHPLLSPEQLQSWTGQAMTLDNYQALICTAEALQPQNFPFLDRELPTEFALENCP